MVFGVPVAHMKGSIMGRISSGVYVFSMANIACTLLSVCTSQVSYACLSVCMYP